VKIRVASSSDEVVDEALQVAVVAQIVGRRPRRSEGEDQPQSSNPYHVLSVIRAEIRVWDTDLVQQCPPNRAGRQARLVQQGSCALFRGRAQRPELCPLRGRIQYTLLMDKSQITETSLPRERVLSNIMAPRGDS